ncbi:putative 26S proteasome regulatory subunit-like [Colletotrichum gloeosporioides]|uniref:Putative 26S proteasome regulatory subunit-like n=1 Tax=Colletotrichum gloeosporioides TaxID=474922 RepID=A0A8H4CN10_COLGL|nr:putative 26S proteasome regulatory subunit-like [Colletotrichum gloeosporioides]KAF3806905.1 putative 26S proteasome regulatory subunit-like [Colletotrichum gloeosporioides]
MATDNVHHRMTTNPQPRKSGSSQRVNKQRQGKDAKHRHVMASASSGGSIHAMQDYQIQLALLELQNKKRLAWARQEQPAGGGDYDPGNGGSDTLEGATVPTQVDDPASRETTQPHYTISEDEIGTLAYKTGAPQHIEPSSRSGAAQAVIAKLSDKEREPTNSRHPKATVSGCSGQLRSVESSLPTFPSECASHAVSQRNLHGHSPSSIAQRRKQPDKTHWILEATQETQKMNQNHGLRYSPADASEVFETGELFTEQCFSSGLDAGATTPNSSEDIQMVIPETDEVPDEAFSDPLSAEQTSSTCFNVLQKMKQRIQQLEAENEKLSRPPPAVAVRVRIFHCLQNEDMDEHTYLSEPEWMVNEDDIRLSARSLLMDPKRYIKKEKGISFVVYKCYSEDHQRDAVEEARKFSGPLPHPVPAYQDILLTSKEMVDAVKAFFALHPASRGEFPKVNTDDRLSAPFIWWYHHRKSNKIGCLPHRQAELVNALIGHIEQAYAPLYDNIDEQLSRGFVSNASMEYLFRPGQVLISFTDGIPQGHIAISRPFTYSDEPDDYAIIPTSKRRRDPSEKYLSQWNISTRSISYRGNFVRVEEKLKIEFETETETGEIDISTLPVVPLEYTSEAVQERLRRRGHTIWKCREKRLISYQGKRQIHTGERFMIDYDTYTSLHPVNSYAMKATKAVAEPGLPADGSEPRAPEIYLFPNMVPGFDLRRKTWVDVEVDQIKDVVWNEHAFKSLVADEDMKSLILALVTNQIDAKRGTDIIHNKGNGLIMLLHGSPGTGKTFTAESVAEIAKKPLYSVTCGDIGTNPADVEKNLESVFHLGKIWDCVVLLDEAEIFLEQRTVQDLQRNALVSVFFRALEYYDGILILTTNRVGTFDEAFKSRIQLALRYEKLEAYQRKQIWKNFFERLKGIAEEDNIDFDDISLHIDELTRHPMNGRQIRNTITTARQLAKFMGKKMVFSHLQRTIAITNKFDQYLADVWEADVEEHGGRGLDGR